MIKYKGLPLEEVEPIITHAVFIAQKETKRPRPSLVSRKAHPSSILRLKRMSVYKGLKLKVTPGEEVCE